MKKRIGQIFIIKNYLFLLKGDFMFNDVLGWDQDRTSEWAELSRKIPKIVVSNFGGTVPFEKV